MRKNFLFLFSLILVATISASFGWWLTRYQTNPGDTFLSPLVKDTPKPLLAYTIRALSQRQYYPSQIQVEKLLTTTPEYSSYLFSYQTLNKKMTGQLNVPTNLDPTRSVPAVVMLRGYVPPELYQTGVGTKNAAAVLAKNGFITVAPDFFGFGQSDPEPTDTWQARFEKPIAVIELLKTLEAGLLTIPHSQVQGDTPAEPTTTNFILNIGKIGLWGHSNGGQIALTTLEILNTPLPTSLWAPVSVPFPYSLLFFSDENSDEGKAMRKWLSLFEKDYDVYDFSLTQHLDRLQGPLQLHHGTADEAALKVWSDEFADKIKDENQRRLKLTQEIATGAATLGPTENLTPLELTYFTYPGANHNLQPDWNTVVSRDVTFFQKNLGL